MHKRIRVTATLKSPFIKVGHMTLDRILAAQLFDELGDVDKAHASSIIGGGADLPCEPRNRKDQVSSLISAGKRRRPHIAAFHFVHLSAC